MEVVRAKKKGFIYPLSQWLFNLAVCLGLASGLVRAGGFNDNAADLCKGQISDLIFMKTLCFSCMC